MGLFGDVDVAEIPDDPFWVDDGVYFCVLTEAKHIVPKTEDKNHGVALRFVIQEEDSEFDGSQLNLWRNYYPGIKKDELTKEIKQDLSRLKNTMIQIGVSEDEMDQENFFEEVLPSYIGTEAYVTVKNTTAQDNPEKKYRNITGIRLPAPDEE